MRYSLRKSVKNLYRAAALKVSLLASAGIAAAQTVNIQPQPPPGLGEKIEMFLGWLYWIAIVASITGVIVGAVMIWSGRDNGRQILIGALIALAILATLGQILEAIGI